MGHFTHPITPYGTVTYGGNLFNPDRFPFLEGRKPETSWRDTEANPLPINNRTVLHLLEALQLLQIKVPGGGPAEARRLSFRALDIEQIGHVYEGLLDHTAKRAAAPFLGLAGTREKEPELPLAELEKLLVNGEADLVKFLKEETGKSENAVKKSLKVEFDTQDAERFRIACQSDDDLWKRVKPLAGLVRLDNFGYPVVITTGSIFVTSGTDRRSSGTHYTPKSLTEPIVQYTLEPLVYIGPAEGLPRDQWKLRSAKELLALKICDMACGSGAFLVQTCRYLAARLLEAWDAVQRANPGLIHITPEGEPSTGKPGEMLIPDNPDERQTYARRIVAQRCLYGVDKNPLAVEMCKLSLWLLTMAKNKPFEFLDHNIRWGDSLVGIHDLEQLRHYSLKPDTDDAVLFKGPLDSAVDDAINLRLKLVDLPANSVEDVERQEKLLIEANEKMARLRCAADLLVAAEFWGGNAKDKLERVRHAAVKSGYYVENGPTEEFEQVAAKERRGQSMFHWPLEFPEVIVTRGGFDAFVGNPPYRHGSRISTDHGTSYLNWLLARFEESRGKGDICAYFIRQAAELTTSECLIGVVVTKTIAEGETRTTCLEYLTSNGFSICRADTDLPWPGTADTLVTVLHLYRGSWLTPNLNGNSCSSINAKLTGSSHDKPYTLGTNAGLAQKGSELLGDFFLDDLTRQRLQQLPKDRRFVFPFINGDDFGSSPYKSASRWVLYFGDMSHSQCEEEAPEAIRIIRQQMKVDNSGKSAATDRKKWWQYHRSKADLYERCKPLRRVLVRPNTSEYMPADFLPNAMIYSNTLVVYCYDTAFMLGVLSNTIHEEWARDSASHLITRLRYTPSTCFETFPMPPFSARIEERAEQLARFRDSIREESNLGLTDLYSRHHDPEQEGNSVAGLRELHESLTSAVAAAYGWTDLDLAHGFHETKQGVRFTVCETTRREVLQRLLKLNHERYAEEVKQGLHDKKKGSAKRPAAKRTAAKRTAANPVKDETTLFDTEDDE